MKVEIKNRFTGSVLFEGEFTSIKLCLEAAVKVHAPLGGADLRGADLRDADLRDAYLGGADLTDADLTDADLRGADLGGADLGGADLRGAKNYAQSHDIFAQLIVNNTIKFTLHEQEMAFRIGGLRLCWDSIRKEYGKKIMPVFTKLAKLGWDEFLKEWKSR